MAGYSTFCKFLKNKYYNLLIILFDNISKEDILTKNMQQFLKLYEADDEIIEASVTDRLREILQLIIKYHWEYDRAKLLGKNPDELKRLRIDLLRKYHPNKYFCSSQEVKNQVSEVCKILAAFSYEKPQGNIAVVPIPTKELQSEIHDLQQRVSVVRDDYNKIKHFMLDSIASVRGVNLFLQQMLFGNYRDVDSASLENTSAVDAIKYK